MGLPALRACQEQYTGEPRRSASRSFNLENVKEKDRVDSEAILLLTCDHGSEH